SDGGQIPRRTRVQRERLLQRLTLDGVRVRRQYVLEDAALERQEHCAEQIRIELRQFFERRVDTRRPRCRRLGGRSCARRLGGRAGFRIDLRGRGGGGLGGGGLGGCGGVGLGL